MSLNIGKRNRKNLYIVGRVSDSITVREGDFMSIEGAFLDLTKAYRYMDSLGKLNSSNDLDSKYTIRTVLLNE